MDNKEVRRWVLSLSGGMLLGLANVGWTAFLVIPGLALLLQVGMEIRKKDSPKSSYLSISVGLLFWQLIGQLQFLMQTPSTVLLYALINALLFTLPFLLYQTSLKAAGKAFGYLIFICYWLTVEYCIEFYWPWQQLGNLLGYYPALAGWYNLTGPSGGTLWILLVAPLARQTLFEGRNRLVFPAMVIIPALIFFFFFAPERLAEEKAVIEQQEGKLYLNQQIITPDDYITVKNADFQSGVSPQFFFITAICTSLPTESPAIVTKAESTLSQSEQRYRKLCSLSTGKPVLFFSGGNWKILPVGRNAEIAIGNKAIEIKTTVQQTFFAKSGNYLGRLAAFLAAIMFLSAFVKNTINKGNRIKRNQNGRDN